MCCLQRKHGKIFLRFQCGNIIDVVKKFISRASGDYVMRESKIIRKYVTGCDK